MKSEYAALLTLCRKIITADGERDDILAAVCSLLKGEVRHYNWVGIYFADQKRKKLKLGPFAGEITEHIKIPFGKGICGQVAMNPKTFVSQDVGAEDNYLACSPWVRSEIVVPIMKNGKFVAQLDIDSHVKASFEDDDVRFLEALCNELAAIL
jgi:L-methionine (R)-S-oxide reductase